MSQSSRCSPSRPDQAVIASILREVCSSEPELMFGLLADVLDAHIRRQAGAEPLALQNRLDEVHLMVALELGQAGLN